MSSTPLDADRTSPHHDATAAVRRALDGRPPRPDALARVEVSTPPVRSCYLTLTRITGEHEAVLDAAAWLLCAEAEPPDGAHTPTEFVAALEDDEGDRLEVVLSRATFGGG